MNQTNGISGRGGGVRVANIIKKDFLSNPLLTLRDPLLTLMGKNPLLLTVVSLQAFQVLPTIPLPGRGIPPQSGDS